MSDKAILSHSILNSIGQAIIDKGGASAPMLPSEMAAAIEAIPTGDPYHNEQWDPPSWMPNLRKILAEDTVTGYAHKYAIIVDDYLEDGGISRYSGAAAMRVGNGNVTTANYAPLVDGVTKDGATFYTVVYYTNADSVYAPTPGGLVWLCSGDDTLNIDLSPTLNARLKLRCLEGNFYSVSNSDYALQTNYALEAIIGSIDLSACTKYSRIFASDFSLRTLPANTVLGDGDGKFTFLFSGCRALKKLPEIDLSRATILGETYSGCSSVSSPIDIVAPLVTTIGQILRENRRTKLSNRIYLPAVTMLSQYMFLDVQVRFFCDEFVATGLTSDINTNVFNYMGSFIWGLPKKFQVNKSFTFSSLTGLKAEYKDSFAKFEYGSLVDDCFASNLYDATGLNLTATMPSVLKGFYSATEQAAIQAAFNAKGWTLAW